MSLIPHRHTGEQETMSSINRMSPLKELLNSAFELASFGPGQERTWSPLMDLREDKEKITVKLEVPGMKKEDINISLENDFLTISGERKFEEEKKEGEMFHSERFYGTFQRSMALPTPVKIDDVKATYIDGILTVVLPKIEEAKPKKIEISVK